MKVLQTSPFPLGYCAMGVNAYLINFLRDDASLPAP